MRDQLLAAGHTMEESELVMCILAGLPRDFDTVVAVLEISDHKLELDTVLSKLLQAEQRLSREEKPDNRAFFSSRSSNQKHRTGTSSTGSIKECCYCGRRGHLKADCLKRKSNEQQGRRNYPRGPGPITGRSGHRSVAARGVSAVNWEHDWVLDSGASNHITGNSDLLTNIRETDHNISVTFANGTVSEAKYMGDALLDTDTATILLRDVLYVPAAAANLFSVTTATRRDTKFHFGLTGCTIHHQGRDIGEAKRGLNGLYYIPSLRDEATALSAYSKAEPAELWHRRFATWATTTWRHLSVRAWWTASTWLSATSRQQRPLCASHASWPSTTRHPSQPQSGTAQKHWSCCTWTCVGQGQCQCLPSAEASM